MTLRRQNTIERVTKLKGFGLFTNADVRLKFLPAPENSGIRFVRVDLSGQPEIPAHIDFLAAEERRTKLVHQYASVEMTEHLLAAFAGLQIDNCRVEIDGPELPGCDGSALPYAEALLDAGIVPQSAHKEKLQLKTTTQIEDDNAVISAEPYDLGLRLSYELDYGRESPIPLQMADFTITPETFISKIASARTFVLEKEIAYLKQKGYGQKVTAQDLLVYGEQGPIENSLRAHNECARHKLLDCLGDLLLCGLDLQGHVRAFRSGHRHNHLLARQFAHIDSQRSIVRAA